MNVRTVVRILIEITAFFVLSLGLTVTSGIYDVLNFSKHAPSPNSPSDLDLSYVPVSFTAQDGTLLGGWLIPAKGGQAKAAVVVLHGFFADKGALLPHISFLADRFDVLTVDFRRFGDSAKTLSTVGDRERLDAVAAVDFMKERGYRHIGLYGFGLGGSVALSQAENPLVSAIVSEAAYSDLRFFLSVPFAPFGVLQKPLQWIAVQSLRVAGIDLYGASPIATLPGTKKPVLVIHARGDMVVPFANAQAISSALNGDPNAEFWFPDSGIHGEGTQEFAERLLDFFSARLR